MNWLLVRVGVLISVCVPYICGAKGASIAIQVDPASASESAMPIWLGYLMERQVYHIQHNLPLPASGEIQPSFDEEVSARNGAVQIYKELKEKDKGLHEAYWETLSQIKAKGFMKAYVWTYLRRREWPNSQKPGNLEEFQVWSRVNLRNHKPQTVGRLAVEQK